jgi:hypothetical protein
MTKMKHLAEAERGIDRRDFLRAAAGAMLTSILPTSMAIVKNAATAAPEMQSDRWGDAIIINALGELENPNLPNANRWTVDERALRDMHMSISVFGNELTTSSRC